MAINPMQRKARTSFILGMMITLVITGAIIALLVMQIMNMTKEQKEKEETKQSVYVLKRDVKSGDIITSSMVEEREIDSSAIPKNATGIEEVYKSWSLVEKETNNPVTVETENEGKSNSRNVYYITDKDGNKQALTKEDEKYYIEKNGEKQEVELSDSPIVAKITLKANTILTEEYITRADDAITKDTRRQEYNIAILPTDLVTGETVDIRASFPNGQDFIVVAKKRVEIPNLDGIDSMNTFFANLSEGEILQMSSAIVETAKIPGSKIYLTKYVEPGSQEAATPNYVPNQEVLNELIADETAETKAKNVILSRLYNVENGQITGLKENSDALRSNIQSQLNDPNIDTQSNLETKVQESITNSQSTRKQYVESLSGATEQSK